MRIAKLFREGTLHILIQGCQYEQQKESFSRDWKLLLMSTLLATAPAIWQNKTARSTERSYLHLRMEDLNRAQYFYQRNLSSTPNNGQINTGKDTENNQTYLHKLNWRLNWGLDYSFPSRVVMKKFVRPYILYNIHSQWHWEYHTHEEEWRI